MTDKSTNQAEEAEKAEMGFVGLPGLHRTKSSQGTHRKASFYGKMGNLNVHMERGYKKDKGGEEVQSGEGKQMFYVPQYLLKTPPVIRQFWSSDRQTVIINDTEPVEDIGWVEYFIDLIYVALFIHATKVMKQCGAGDTNVTKWAFMGITFFWSLRYQIDEYFIYFALPKSVSRPIMMFYCLGIYMILSNSHVEVCSADATQVEVAFVATGFIITRLVLLLMYVHAVIHHPLTTKQFSIHIGIQGFAIFSVIISQIASPGFKSLESAFIFVFCMDFFNIFIKRAPILFMEPLNVSRDFLLSYVAVPNDVWKAEERHGIFILMAIGEVIITSMSAEGKELDADARYHMYSLFYGSFFVCVVFAMDYFEEVFRSEHNTHVAMTASTAGGCLWETLHCPLAFVILLMGVGLKVCMYDVSNYGELHNPFYMELTGTAIGCGHLIMITMIGLHTLFIHERQDKKKWKWDRYPWFLCVRFALASLHFIVKPAFYSNDSEESLFMFVHAAILCSHRVLKFINEITASKDGNVDKNEETTRSAKRSGGEDTAAALRRGSDGKRPQRVGTALRKTRASQWIKKNNIRKSVLDNPTMIGRQEDTARHSVMASKVVETHVVQWGSSDEQSINGSTHSPLHQKTGGSESDSDDEGSNHCWIHLDVMDFRDSKAVLPDEIRIG